MENLNEMGEYLNTEIVCTLAGLGYAEGNEYYKSPDCLESLKDLIRFLRCDDTTCEIRRQLGYSEVLQNDLVAILKSCSHKEREIFDMVIRLMVNLTQPAVLCFQNKIPDDKTGQHYYLDLVSQLQSYKEVFTEKEVISVIGRELGRLLQMEWDDRLEEDSLLIERILLLIRNILHVPANRQAEKRTDDDASVHDQVIWNLHTNGIDDLLLYIASSPDERRWSMHILEIVSLMLREQNPESLAKAGDQRSRTEKKEDERQLEILREQELAEKLKNARKFSGRHSRFGGTFHVQNMRAINDANQLIYHRPLAEVKNMTFDHNKTAPKKRKKQQLAKEMGEERRSTLSIRIFLKDFCRECLRQCYNPLMNVVKDNIKHGRSQENDESYYLWSMRFFMEFSRHHNFRVDFVSETLSVVSFTDLLAIITKLYDAYESNKAEASVWGRRLHLAVQAYKELMLNVMWMDKSEDKNLHENAKIIKGNIFYMSEYRDTLLLLLKKFNMTSQTKGYLRDLVDAFHIFLKMLERYCAGKTHIVVKKKKRATKKKHRTSHAGAPPSNLTPEQIEEKWQDLSSDLSSTLQGHQGDIPESIVPFDAASEIPVDEQKTNALSQIQSFLRNERCGEAVALLRAARDVWPNDQFGTADISAEDEFMCFYDIYRMDLPVVAAPQTENGFIEGEDDDINPEEEEMAAVETREAEFSVQDFLKKLATPAIVQPYTWLLKYYKENKDFTNHAIVKMLHRVAVDLKMPAMLFQMSLFCTFQKILNDPAGTHYKEMVKFARYIVGKFFEMLPKNPVLLVELAIWKNSGDCYEIMEGYGTLALRSASQNAATWTSEEEEELRQLYEEYKDSDDLVDKILEAISNETRSRRQITNKLVALNLVTDRRELRKKAPKRSRWPEEEVEQLRALYEEYKNSEEDVVEKIMAHMLNASRTRRQVVIKLVQLGIVEDRKMLRKKRTKGEKRKKKVDDFINDNENESSDSDDSDMEEGFKAPPSSSDDSESDADGDDDVDETGDSLADHVRKLNETGLKDQVQWINSKLLKTADDRESTDKEKWQPLPLVTITEESEEALSNKLFKQMLRKIGLVPPANEQEMFWRIPLSLSPEKLRKAADILDDNDLVGKDLADLTEHSTPPSNSKNSARKKKLATLAAERKKSGTASSRKRKERSRPVKEKTSSAKTWRQGLNERIADDDIGSHSYGDSIEGQKENARESSPSIALPADDDGGLRKKDGSKKTKHRVKGLDDSDEEDSASMNQSESEPKETNQSDSEGGGKSSIESGAGNNGNIRHEDETVTSVIEKKKLTQIQDSDDEGLDFSKDESDYIDHVNNNSTKDSSEIGKKRPRDEEASSDNDDEEFNLPLTHHKKAKRILIEDDDED